jgi:hypothetical protein
MPACQMPEPLICVMAPPDIVDHVHGAAVRSRVSYANTHPWYGAWSA